MEIYVRSTENVLSSRLDSGSPLFSVLPVKLSKLATGAYARKICRTRYQSREDETNRDADLRPGLRMPDNRQR